MFQTLPKHYGWVMLLATFNSTIIFGSKEIEIQKKIASYASDALSKYRIRFEKKVGEVLSPIGMPDKGNGRISAHLPTQIKTELSSAYIRNSLDVDRWMWMGPLSVLP